MGLKALQEERVEWDFVRWSWRLESWRTRDGRVWKLEVQDV